MEWTEEIELPPSFVILAQQRNAQGQATRAIRRVREPRGLLVDAGVRGPLIGRCIIEANDVRFKQLSA